MKLRMAGSFVENLGVCIFQNCVKGKVSVAATCKEVTVLKVIEMLFFVLFFAIPPSAQLIEAS